MMLYTEARSHGFFKSSRFVETILPFEATPIAGTRSNIVTRKGHRAK